MTIISELFAIWLALVSLVLFIFMGSDKRRAIKHRRRTPEASLFLLAFIGGGIGGVLGMFAFRHKTKHLKFILGFPAIAICQIGILVYMLIKGL